MDRHHRVNPSNKPPRVERLAAAAAAQGQIANYSDEEPDKEGLEEDEEDEDEDEDEDNGPSRAPRHSLGKKDLDPTNLNFYPPMWQIVLHRAKVEFRKIVATSLLFPNIDKDYSIAVKIIANEIVKAQDEGLQLEPGKCFQTSKFEVFLSFYYSYQS